MNKSSGIESTLLRITGLSYGYPSSAPGAIGNVSFDWEKGELLVLAGPAGSGKSTLGKILKGLIKPDSGLIEVIEAGGSNVLTQSELLDLVGWIDAQPERQIFGRNVAEEVGFAAINGGIRGAELGKRVSNALMRVELDPDRFLARDPLTLSGGEKRRVAIASTIVVPTPFLILDEPEAGLDESGIRMIVDLVNGLVSSGVGIIVITHDPAAIWQNADRVLAFEEGRLAGDFSSAKLDWNNLTHWLETGDGKPQ